MIPRLVLLDCDGVLVDSEAIAGRILAAELSAMGWSVSADDCRRRFTGRTMADVRAAAEAELGRALPPDFETTLKTRDEAAFRAELRAVPGAAEMLRTLPCAKAVASSGSLAKMRFTLGLTGLLPLVEPHLFSAEMVARGKPAPDLFLHAAAVMNAPPDTCLVIEDSPAGVLAARAAGMAVFGFTGASHMDDEARERLRAAGPDRLIGSFAALGKMENPFS